MTDTFKNQLLVVKEKLQNTIQSTKEERKHLSEQIDVLNSYTSKYDDSWGGNWIDKPCFFHKNFNPSNRDEMNVDESYIKKDLLKISHVDLNVVKDRTKLLLKVFFELRDFILSELSFINDIDAFKNETELLKQIEVFKWSMKTSEYVRYRRPTSLVVQDTNILNKNLLIPPHIAVGGEIIYALSLLSSYDNFQKLSHRLIRQLEIKLSISPETDAGVVFQQQALKAIIEKFHNVATQLRNRYNGRQSIEIVDEYDVQDLMNGLLRINFEDIRKEEYTPSYAGSSTRVDFLLKREKILIEVKKTRDTLKDKEIGKQLVLDIAHYKSHPDCKHLICFVYDPDNLVLNPRGLEDDLNTLSTEEMLVEVFIRP